MSDGARESERRKVEERKDGNKGKVERGRGEGVKGHVDVWVKDVTLAQESK